MKSIGIVVVACMVTSLTAMDHEQVRYNTVENTIEAYHEQVIGAYALRTTIAKSLDTEEYFARSVTYDKQDEQHTVLTEFVEDDPDIITALQQRIHEFELYDFESRKHKLDR